MARTLNLRFTGQAEKLLIEMNRKGLNDQDAISKALWLFQIAWESERVALLDADGEVQYIFTVRPIAEASKDRTANVAEGLRARLADAVGPVEEVFGEGKSILSAAYQSGKEAMEKEMEKERGKLPER
jgi:hypothetical protein